MAWKAMSAWALVKAWLAVWKSVANNPAALGGKLCHWGDVMGSLAC